MPWWGLALLWLVGFLFALSLCAAASDEEEPRE